METNKVSARKRSVHVRVVPERLTHTGEASGKRKPVIRLHPGP